MNDTGTFAMGKPAVGHQTEKASVWREAFPEMSTN